MQYGTHGAAENFHGGNWCHGILICAIVFNQHYILVIIVFSRPAGSRTMWGLPNLRIGSYHLVRLTSWDQPAIVWRNLNDSFLSFERHITCYGMESRVVRIALDALQWRLHQSTNSPETSLENILIRGADGNRVVSNPRIHGHSIFSGFIWTQFYFDRISYFNVIWCILQRKGEVSSFYHFDISRIFYSIRKIVLCSVRSRTTKQYVIIMKNNDLK